MPNTDQQPSTSPPERGETGTLQESPTTARSPSMADPISRPQERIQIAASASDPDDEGPGPLSLSSARLARFAPPPAEEEEEAAPMSLPPARVQRVLAGFADDDAPAPSSRIQSAAARPRTIPPGLLEEEPAPLSSLPAGRITAIPPSVKERDEAAPLSSLPSRRITTSPPSIKEEAAPLSFLPARGDAKVPSRRGALADAAPQSGFRPLHGLAEPRSTEKTFTIKVLREPEELRLAYRLRYDIFESLNYIQQANAARLEIDEYDRYSIPFGAFVTSTMALVGTLRLITLRVQPYYRREIQRIMDESGDENLRATAAKARRNALPSLNCERVEAMLKEFNEQKQKIQELSRTIVHPTYRGLGVSRGLMEFGLAQVLTSGAPILIGACIPQHVAMYANYGYVKLPGTAIQLNEAVGQFANTVVCNTMSLPEPTSSHVNQLITGLKSGAVESILDMSEDPRGVYGFNYRTAPQRRSDSMLAGRADEAACLVGAA